MHRVIYPIRQTQFLADARTGRFSRVGLCIYESPWLRGDDPPEYVVNLEENMVVALDINHYPVKLEHLLRITASAAEILSRYPVDPELIPA